MLGTFVSATLHDSLVQAARGSASPWLQFDARTVAQKYNRLPFLLQHRLAEHPDFELEPLFALCRRLPPSEVKYRTGVVPADAHFDSSLSQYRRDLTLDDAIDNLEARQAYIAIYNPEQDDRYRPIIETLIGEIGLAVQGHEHCINWYSTYIFISARDSLTPYHMDREMNFLLQIRGRKTAQLWDPNDDAVMSPAERDHLFSHGEDARPAYRPSLESLAMTFELEPGLGVHHPFIAPHLVRTGPELSVSLAVTFRTPRSDQWSDAHRFNERVLRRLGLPAGRVGSAAPSANGAKAATIRALRKGKTLVVQR